MPQVGIISGSKSDEPILQETLKLLAEPGVEAELTVASAHRNPDRVRQYEVEEIVGREITLAEWHRL